MKKRIAFLAVPAMMLAASANAHAHLDFTPYAGADVQYRNMDFKPGYGSNLFSHHQPQGNIYVGAKFHEYFGVEGGFETSNRQYRSVALSKGDVSLGSPVNNTTSYNSSARMYGPHINLVGFMPICHEHQLKLIGLVGAADLKTHFRNTDTSTNVISGFKKRKTVLRLGAGLEHMFTCNWGVRAAFIWENTARIQASTRSSTALVKPENTFIYSLGAFVSF